MSASSPSRASIIFVTYVCEQIAQNLPIVLLIFDHQYALAHVPVACCSSRAGTKKEKVAP
jgi:hypothetical protein